MEAEFHFPTWIALTLQKFQRTNPLQIGMVPDIYNQKLFWNSRPYSSARNNTAKFGEPNISPGRRQKQAQIPDNLSLAILSQGEANCNHQLIPNANRSYSRIEVHLRVLFYKWFRFTNWFHSANWSHLHIEPSHELIHIANPSNSLIDTILG